MDFRHTQTSLDNTKMIRLGKTRSSALEDYLVDSELTEWADRTQIWEIIGTNRELAYLTHGVFRFFGKFPPPVAERFIKELHRAPDGPILDPMVGSGTTLVEAMRLGRESVGMDSNPLSTLLSKVKTTYIPPSVIDDNLEEIKKYFQGIKNPDWEIPSDPYMNHWFFPKTQGELAALLQSLDDLRRKGVIRDDSFDFFRVAIVGIVRQVSRASKGMGRMFLDPALQPLDTFEVFSKRVTKMSSAIARLEGLGPKPNVVEGDARRIKLSDRSVGLVICHPPYFNLYRYSSIYKFELLWLGMSYKDIRKTEIREGFKLAKRELVVDYVKDMVEILSESWRVLASKRYCVLMIGDTVIKARHVPVTSMILHSLPSEHFEIERILIRVPKYTEASYSAAQRRNTKQVGVKLPDHLIVMRKK